MTDGRLAHIDRRKDARWDDLSVGDLLRTVTAEVPDALALCDLREPDGSQRRWTYAQMLSEAERIAQHLLSHCEPGERVGIWSESSSEWQLLLYGCTLAGMPVVSLNPALKSVDLTHALSQGEVVHLFHAAAYRGTDLAEVLAEVRADCPLLRNVFPVSDWQAITAPVPSPKPLPVVDPESAMVIQYTSGTTGKARGAILSHKASLNNLRVCEEDLALEPGSGWIASMPFATISGAVVQPLMAMWNRGYQIMLPRFEPTLFFRAVAEERGACAPLVPTMLIMLLDHPDCAATDFDSLKRIYAGGAPVPASLARRANEALDCGIVIIWGQTEACGMVTHSSPADPIEVWTSCTGKPLPGREVRIADPNTGQTLERGQDGEILVRGLVMGGYLGLPEETAQSLDAEGWLHTGDVGNLDAEGYLRVTGRLKEMIIRGGMNIYPKEIEDQLIQHPDIAEVAVFGVPSEKWGEIVGAAIRHVPSADPLTQADLAEFLAQRLAYYKIPHIVLPVDVMPLAVSEKVDKKTLAARCAALVAA